MSRGLGDVYKRQTKSSKIKAHDDSNSVKEGDRVVIAECRPISKDKSWTVIKVENEKSGS